MGICTEYHTVDTDDRKLTRPVWIKASDGLPRRVATIGEAARYLTGEVSPENAGEVGWQLTAAALERASRDYVPERAESATACFENLCATVRTRVAAPRISRAVPPVYAPEISAIFFELAPDYTGRRQACSFSIVARSEKDALDAFDANVSEIEHAAADRLARRRFNNGEIRLSADEFSYGRAPGSSATS